LGGVHGDGDGDAAGAGAEVEDVCGEFADGFEGDVDEVFGLGSRDEDGGAAGKGEGVELPFAQNVGNGFVVESALEEVLEGVWRVRRVEGAEEFGAGHAEGVGHEDFGVEAWGVGDGFERLGRGEEGFADGGHD